jgi:hypothetical protein
MANVISKIVEAYLSCMRQIEPGDLVQVYMLRGSTPRNYAFTPYASDQTAQFVIIAADHSTTPIIGSAIQYGSMWNMRPDQKLLDDFLSRDCIDDLDQYRFAYYLDTSTKVHKIIKRKL